MTDHFENTFLFSFNNNSSNCQKLPWTVKFFWCWFLKRFGFGLGCYRFFNWSRNSSQTMKKQKKNRIRGKVSFFFYSQAPENTERVRCRQWGLCKTSAFHSSCHESGETSHLQAQYHEAFEEVPECPSTFSGAHKDQVSRSTWQQPVSSGIQQPHCEYQQTELTPSKLFLLLHFVMESQQVERRNPCLVRAKRGKGETKNWSPQLELAGCSQGGAESAAI